MMVDKAIWNRTADVQKRVQSSADQTASKVHRWSRGVSTTARGVAKNKLGMLCLSVCYCYLSLIKYAR